MEGESLTFKCLLHGKGNLWNTAWNSGAHDSFINAVLLQSFKCSLHVLLDMGGLATTKDLLIVVSLVPTSSLTLCMYGLATALGPVEYMGIISC